MCLRSIAELRSTHTKARRGDTSQRLPLIRAVSTGIGSHKATGPRDLIYGVLGLVLDRDIVPIVADYSLTTAQAFARAAVKMAKSEQNLSFLCLAETAHNHKFELPSWTLDWSCSGPFSGVPIVGNLFNACLGSKFEGELQQDLCLSV